MGGDKPMGFTLQLLPVVLTLLWIVLQVCYDATRQPTTEQNPKHSAAFKLLYRPFFAVLLALGACGWVYTIASFIRGYALSPGIPSLSMAVSASVVFTGAYGSALYLVVKFFYRIRAILL
jgi:hypothetical protein